MYFMPMWTYSGCVCICVRTSLLFPTGSLPETTTHYLHDGIFPKTSTRVLLSNPNAVSALSIINDKESQEKREQEFRDKSSAVPFEAHTRPVNPYGTS
jgi:hypothetical protein